MQPCEMEKALGGEGELRAAGCEGGMPVGAVLDAPRPPRSTASAYGLRPESLNTAELRRRVNTPDGCAFGIDDDVVSRVGSARAACVRTGTSGAGVMAVAARWRAVGSLMLAPVVPPATVEPRSC